jgi:hypothetical protein
MPEAVSSRWTTGECHIRRLRDRRLTLRDAAGRPVPILPDGNPIRELVTRVRTGEGTERQGTHLI